MFCKKCGHERQEGEKFCPVCGTPFPIDHDEGEPIDPSQKKKKDLGLTPVVLTHAVQNSAKRKRTVKAKAASAPAKHVQVSQVQEELPARSADALKIPRQLLFRSRDAGLGGSLLQNRHHERSRNREHSPDVGRRLQ